MDDDDEKPSRKRLCTIVVIAIILILGWTTVWPAYVKSNCNRRVTKTLQAIGYPYIHREFYGPLYQGCLHRHGI